MMGDRYYLTVKCPKCDHTDNDIYFAPTCGFTEWTCPSCGYVIDLCEETGLTYDDCSNADLIADICNKAKANL